jgi:hypothetical protein
MFQTTKKKHKKSACKYLSFRQTYVAFHEKHWDAAKIQKYTRCRIPRMLIPHMWEKWFDQHRNRGLEQNQQIKGSQSAWGVLQSAAKLGFPEQVLHFRVWLFWENYKKPTKLYVLVLEALKCFGLRVQGWPLDSLGRAQAYDWGKFPYIFWIFLDVSFCQTESNFICMCII